MKYLYVKYNDSCKVYKLVDINSGNMVVSDLSTGRMFRKNIDTDQSNNYFTTPIKTKSLGNKRFKLTLYDYPEFHDKYGKCTVYICDDHIHNKRGAAIIYKEGEKIDKRYFIRGVEYTKEQFLEAASEEVQEKLCFEINEM